MTKQAPLVATLLCCAVALTRADSEKQDPAGQSPIAIRHDPQIGCVVAGQYPMLSACSSPKGEAAQSKVYFRAPGAATWYYVSMKPVAKPDATKPDETCYEGVLPKPKKSLKAMDFYFEALGKSFAENRTQDFTARVVGNKSECEKDKLVAPVSSTGPAAVFGAGPGFVVGVGGAVLPIAGAAVIGGGVALGAGAFGGNDNSGGGTSGVTTTTLTTTTTLAPTTTPVPPTTTTTTTLPATPNRPPEIACLMIPSQGVIAPGQSVRFRTCGSRDPDGDDLRFEYEFGDGDGDGGSCEATHTYPNQGTFNAKACVTDRRPDHKRCCEFRVSVEVPNQCSGTPPTTAITSPTGTGSGPFSWDGTVSASASDDDGVASVSFFATPTNDAGVPSGPPILIGSDTTAPYGATWPVGSSCSFYKYNLTSQATDTCGNVGTSASVWVIFYTGCGFAPADTFSNVSWTSELEAPGTAGRVSWNDVPLAVGEGRQQAIARVRRGDNRVDAELVDAQGKPGLWRFELGGAVAAGSLRVLSGEVVQATDTVVVFRLAGKPGERVSFAFRSRH